VADELRFPDVSEYQTVNFGLYSGPIIVRAHNSNRSDYHWVAHAAGASQQPWWGAYQYLTASADPLKAAQAFIVTLGTYRPNVVICDLEEGDGDQSGRWRLWEQAMLAFPAKKWLYTGLAYAKAHNLHPDWVAAYGQTEPTMPHVLWQYADNAPFPGIGNCDGNLFHGTVQDLTWLTDPPQPVPVPDPEDDMNRDRFILVSRGAWYLVDTSSGFFAANPAQTTPPMDIMDMGEDTNDFKTACETMCANVRQSK
jgi:hypothetical protein